MAGQNRGLGQGPRWELSRELGQGLCRELSWELGQGLCRESSRELGIPVRTGRLGKERGEI